MSKLLYTTDCTKTALKAKRKQYKVTMNQIFEEKKNNCNYLICAVFFLILRKIYKSVPMDSDIDKTSFGYGIMTRDFLKGFMTNKICC